jgi:hypothetical protein
MEAQAKPKKINALTQEEINYVATHEPNSPTLVMLANTVYLVRCEIKRINAEYLLAKLDEAMNEAINKGAT